MVLNLLCRHMEVVMSDKGIGVYLDESRAFSPRAKFAKNAHIKSIEEYEKLYKWSIEDPEDFWADMAEENLVWFKKWDKVLEYDFEKPFINWFKGGKLNVSYNCLDRYVNTPSYRNKAALIWEADDG